MAETPTGNGFPRPGLGERFQVARHDIEEIRQDGTLMPDGLTAAMSPAERRDLVRFLFDLGRTGSTAADGLRRHSHAMGEFVYDRAPLHPEQWPNWHQPVNRDRIYDFYAKEAAYFSKQPSALLSCPPSPGLDGGKQGHWGNQNEDTWADGRWNQTDLGTVLSGVFRGAGVTVPKGVCVRLGEQGELAACFNPETLCYDALWSGGFVKFSAVRHGIMDGLIMDGTPLPRPRAPKPDKPFVYHGFYRHGKRVVFAYRIGDVELLDAPWVENGRFTGSSLPLPSTRWRLRCTVAPRSGRRCSKTKGSSGRAAPGRTWSTRSSRRCTTPGTPCSSSATTTSFPTARPCSARFRETSGASRDSTELWKSVRWNRFASGLHQALGLVIADGVALCARPRSDHPAARSEWRRRGRFL